MARAVGAAPDAPGAVMQLCHGAPGLVASLAALAPTDGLNELLLGAASRPGRAGPLAKGPGLCHGTAGNGYAF